MCANGIEEGWRCMLLRVLTSLLYIGLGSGMEAGGFPSALSMAIVYCSFSQLLATNAKPIARHDASGLVLAEMPFLHLQAPSLPTFTGME